MTLEEIRRLAGLEPSRPSLDEARGTVVDKVYELLRQDYPLSAIEWVRRVSWRGPVEVPLSQIDYSGEKRWSAYHEPDRVEFLAKKIRKGKGKPIILVKRPGEPLFLIADGHHRSLASKKMHRPVLAYVATVSTVKGPWDELHGKQTHDDSMGLEHSRQLKK